MLVRDRKYRFAIGAALAVAAMVWCLPATVQGQTWPNAPSNGVIVRSESWNTNTPSGWCAVDCGAGIGTITQSNLPNMVSPQNVLRHDYNVATYFGNGGNHTAPPIGPYSELYVGMVHRTNSDFQGWFNCTNKVYYFWLGDALSDRQSDFIVELYCPSGQQTPLSLGIQTHDSDNCHIGAGTGNCPGTYNLFPNKNGFSYLTGNWSPGVFHKTEFYLKKSSTATSKDGIIRWWIDGVLWGDFTNVNFPNCAPAPCSAPGTPVWGVTEIGIDQAWDGSVDTTRTVADFWETDETIIMSCSGPCQFGVGETNPPTAVTGLGATPGNANVSLAWLASSDTQSGVCFYNVQRGASSSGPFTSIQQVQAPSTSYVDTGLFNGTTYYYRVNAQDCAGNPGAFSDVVSATPTAPTGGGSTVVTAISGGRFAINGVPKFMQGISMYDCSNFTPSDVDTLVAKGFNLFVCHLDDVLRNNVNSLYNADGTLKGAKITAFEAFRAYLDTKGAVVLFNLLYADVDGSNSPAYMSSQAALDTAIQGAVAQFCNKGNVLCSLWNEHNYGTCCDDDVAEMGHYMGTARTTCPACFLTYSSSENIGTDSDAHLFVTRSGSTVSPSQVNLELNNGINALLIHNDRQSGWNLLGLARASNMRAYLVSIGRGDLAVLFDEDGREGSGGLGDANAYLTYAANVKAGGVAGWVFHTDAGFDLNAATFMSQLDAVESTVVDNLAAALATSSSVVRDTPLTTLTCDGTVADIGLDWDAGYTGHNAWQTVSGRCQTPGTDQESLESWNGTATANMYIQADVPTLTLAGGDYSEVRLGFLRAPADVSGYECRFGKVPSDTIRITRKDANIPTTLNSLSMALTPGVDVPSCERVGSTIQALVNGTSVLSASDATYPEILRPAFYASYYNATGLGVEVDNVVVGNMVSGPAATTPKITNVVLNTNGATITWEGSLQACKVFTDAGSQIYQVGSGQCDVLVRPWTSADGGYMCVVAIDANGVENTTGNEYQCRPTAGFETTDTTPPTLFNPQPTGTLSAGTTSRVVSWQSTEPCVSRIGASNVAYDSLSSQATNTGGTSHSHTVTGLVDSTTYTFYAGCRDGAGNVTVPNLPITFSVGSSVTDSTRPSTITNLAGTVISSTQIDFSWSPAPTDNVEVARVVLYLCADFACTVKTVWTTADGPATAISKTGLTPGATYIVTARAEDTSGNESAADSNIVTVTTFPLSGQDFIPPSDVDGLALVTAGLDNLTLTFNAGTDLGSGIARTQFERCTGSTCTDFTPIHSTDTTTLTDSSLFPFTTYRYRGKHVDHGGNVSENYSDILTVKTLPIAPGTRLGLCPCRSSARD